MINFIVWIIFGLIVGVVAKFLMPGRDGGGFIITVLLGIIGSVIGGFIARALNMGGGSDDIFNWGRFIFAVIGALVLLIGYRMIKSR